MENEITQQQIDKFNKERSGIIFKYCTAAVVAILMLLWGLNKIPGVVIAFAMTFLFISWFWTKVSKPSGSSSGSNQGKVLTYFFLGLATYMTITVTITLLLMKYVLHSSNFVVTTIAVIINIVLMAMWVQDCFFNDVSGKKLVQLRLNGRLLKSGSNLRPAWWGICKILPFTDWGVVIKKVHDGESQFLQEEKTPSEDGLVVNLKIGENAKSVPRVVKYKASYRITDTYKYESTKDVEKRIPVILFGQIETSLNSTQAGSVDELDHQKAEISRDKIYPALIKPFEEIGLTIDSFDLNAIEPSRVEEKAARDKEAENTKARGLTTMAKEYVDFVGNDPKKAAALQIALLQSGDVNATSLTTNQATPLTGNEGKKGKKGLTPQAAADPTAVRAAVMAMVGDNDNDSDHDHHDGHHHGG